MKDLESYPLVIEESRRLAENLGVDLPAELSVQLGSPAPYELGWADFLGFNRPGDSCGFSLGSLDSV